MVQFTRTNGTERFYSCVDKMLENNCTVIEIFGIIINKFYTQMK